MTRGQDPSELAEEFRCLANLLDELVLLRQRVRELQKENLELRASHMLEEDPEARSNLGSMRVPDWKLRMLAVFDEVKRRGL